MLAVLPSRLPAGTLGRPAASSTLWKSLALDARRGHTLRRCSQTAGQHEPAEEGTSPTSSSGSKPKKTSEELDEAELQRRRKIGEANSGRVPWNKGRKHSPETIAKIKARTAEAMKQPEIQENFKKAMEKRQQVHSDETKAKIGEKVRAALEAKRIAQGKPPKPEKPPKAERKTRRKAPAEGEEASTSQPLESNNVEKSTKARRAARGSSGTDGQEPDAPRQPKKRVVNSEEHKQAIRDAIKAKWQDPEYREYMCQKMKEAAAKRMADPTKPKKSGSSQASTSGSSGSGSAANSKQQQEAWLQQVQGLVAKLLISQQLLANMDGQVAEMQKQAGAFANDPVMLGRMEKVLQTLRSRQQELVQTIAQQKAKIPSNVGYDSQGRVFLKPEGSVESAPRPASPQGSGIAPNGASNGATRMSMGSDGVPNGEASGDQQLYNSLRVRLGGLEVTQQPRI